LEGGPGGTSCARASTQSTIDSEQSVKVFQIYNQLWHDGVVPAYA